MVPQKCPVTKKLAMGHFLGHHVHHDLARAFSEAISFVTYVSDT